MSGLLWKTALLAACVGVGGAAQAAVTVTKAYLQPVVNLGSPQTEDNTPAQGDVRTLRIDVINSGGEVTAGALVDSLPAQVRIAAVPNARASVSCGPVALDAVGGAGTVSYTGATVPAQVGASAGLCSVYVDVVSSVPGNWDNTIAAGGFTGNEAGVGSVSNASPATRTLIVSALSPLNVSKTFSPATVRMGEGSTITITLANPNAGRAVVISRLSENLPPNVTATGTATGGTCGAGTASGTTGTATITLTSPVSVPGNGSCTVTWPVTANAADGNTSTGTNRVPVNSVVNDRGLTHTAATATITVQSPITLAKSFSQPNARAGQDVTLTITVQNRSAGTISNVAYTDNLPTGSSDNLLVSQTLTPANVSAGCGAGVATGTAGGNTISLANATILAGGTCTVTALVSAASPRIVGGDVVAYANTIVSASWTDTFGNSQVTAPASANVTFYSQLTASKALLDPVTGGALSGGLAPGNLVRFRVTLSNYSPSPLSGISVTDPLPAANGAQMVVASSATPGATPPVINCPVGSTTSTDGDTSAVFSGLEIPGGTSANPGVCYVQFDALVPAGWPVGTTLTNTIPRASIGPGLGQTDAVGSAPSVDHFPIAKSFQPTSVSQGQVSRLTFSLANNGFDALTGVSVADPLPLGAGQLRVADPANTATTCGGAPSYGFGAAREQFNVSGLTVPRRSNCTVSVDVVAAVAGTYANDATATGTDSRTGGTVTPPTHALASLTVTPTFSTTKAFSPAQVAASGGVSRVTITVSNVGSGQLDGMAVSDPLPGGVVVAANPDATTTCSGPTTLTAVAGSSAASLGGARLPAGTSCTFQFNVVTDGSAGAADSVNTLPPGAVSANGGIVSNTSTSATLTKIVGAGQPSLNKSFSPASLTTVGQPSRMRVTVMNSAPGAIALTGLGLVDVMPDGMVLTQSPQATSTCTGGVIGAAPGSGTLSLSGATLAAGTSCIVEVNATLTRQGTFVNTLAAGVLTNDQNLSNALPVSANLGSVGAVGLQKSFAPSAVSPNEPSLLTITVINSQPVAMTNLSVVDPLPAGLVPATPSGASTTCGGTLVTGPTEVRLTGGALAAPAPGSNSTCTITLNVVSAAGGAYVNTIPVGNVTADGGVSNSEPATGTLNVRQPLTIAKAFAQATRLVNQGHRLTVTISNPNAVPVTGVTLTDTYPELVFNTTTPAPATTCAGGAVTAPASDNFMRLTGATVPANGSCTFSAEVLSNTAGTYLNTIADNAITSFEGVTNTNPASASFTVLVPPTLGKAFSPVQITSGGTSLLRIELGNENATALTLSSALVDNLPQSPGPMTLSVGGTQAGTTCPGTVTATVNTATVRYASGATIPAGGCVIVVRVTAAASGLYANSIPAGGLSTNGGVNPEPATAVLSISPRNALTGRVYLDRDDDGLVDGGEPALSGETIELLDNANAVIATTRTDSLGNYAFFDLPDGTYAVRQSVQPAGTYGGRTTVGTGAASAGSASGKAAATSQLSGIVLAGSQNAVAYNFGELEPASISGKVFLDANNDGVQQSADSALSGVTLQLSGTDDLGATVSLATTTDAGGRYAFAGLRPGTYTVTEPTQPPGTGNGQTRAGTGSTTTGTATPPTTTPSAVAGIVLSSRQQSTGNDFAEIPNGRTLNGRVYVDTTGNDTFGAGDTPLAGLTVTLTGVDINGLPVTRTTLTQADGAYTFGGLPAGTYGVRYDPAALPASAPPMTTHGNALPGSTGGTGGAHAVQLAGVNLTGFNQQSSGNDLTRRPPATVAGRVYLDVNENGARDGADTGLAAVDLVLTGTDFGPDGVESTPDDGTANVTATTDADGRYGFTVRPGRYVVTEPAQPGGTLNGATHAGTVAGVPMGTATPIGTTPSAVAGLVLAANDASIDNDFGETLSVANLQVGKSHAPAVFTAGHRATYTLRVRNAGSRDSTGAYTVTDRLPAGLTIAVAPVGAGWTCTGAVGAVSFTCTSSTVLAPAATHPGNISVQVDVGASVPPGALHNAVMVEGAGERAEDRPTTADRDRLLTNPAALAACVPALAHDACRDSVAVQAAAAVAGTVWYDVGATAGLRDGSDTLLGGWTVELFDPAAPATVIATTRTAADGRYRLDNLLPGVPLAVRFRDPQSNVVWAGPVSGEQVPGSPATCYPADNPPAGQASACPVAAASMLRVVLAPGQTLVEQSLPVVPTGVVYDAVARQPVPGSTVTLAPVGVCPGYDPATAIVGAALGGYTVSGDTVSMTVGDRGLYQFLFGASAPARCRFALTVTPPAGFVFTSATIPAEATPLAPGAGSNVQVQPQPTAPVASPGSGTVYYLAFDAGSAVAALVNNHLALDPANATGLVVAKTGNRQEVELGDTLMYTLTVRHTAGPAMHAVTLRDRLPAGFTYIRGTARLDGAATADPRGGLGPVLAFDAGGLAVGGTRVVSYRVRVGVGAMQGDGINRVRAHGCTAVGSCVDTGLQPVAGAIGSNEAAHRVKVSGGVFTDDACLAGKVFVDADNDHVQDPEELGVPGVRLYLEDGTWFITDSEGKYSFCGLTPRSHVLKLDPSTLPRGSRLVTSSNRNLGDAGSLWLDVKNGELHRGDFILDGRSNAVLEQVKARRAQGEVRAPETEKRGTPALRFDSKPRSAPAHATDPARQSQPVPSPRVPASTTSPPTEPRSDCHAPLDEIDLQRAPAAAAHPTGGANVCR